MIDDVVVFTGTALLPGLDAKSIKQDVSPLVQAGIRVDRKTVLVKLLESQHPIARAGEAVCWCFLGGLLLISLAQLPWQG